MRHKDENKEAAPVVAAVTIDWEDVLPFQVRRLLGHTDDTKAVPKLCIFHDVSADVLGYIAHLASEGPHVLDALQSMVVHLTRSVVVHGSAGGLDDSKAQAVVARVHRVLAVYCVGSVLLLSSIIVASMFIVRIQSSMLVALMFLVRIAICLQALAVCLIRHLLCASRLGGISRGHRVA